MGCIKSKQGLSGEDLEFLKAHTQYDKKTIKNFYERFHKNYPNGSVTPLNIVNKYRDLNLGKEMKQQ